MICPRTPCDINRTIKAANDFIAREQSQFGFTFSAEMPFAQTCKICLKTRTWVRLADGTIRATDKLDAA